LQQNRTQEAVKPTGGKNTTSSALAKDKLSIEPLITAGRFSRKELKGWGHKNSGSTQLKTKKNGLHTKGARGVSGWGCH